MISRIELEAKNFAETKSENEAGEALLETRIPIGSNFSSLKKWASNGKKLEKSINILKKASAVSQGISWTLRLALLSGLIMSAYTCIRRILDVTNEYNQDFADISCVQDGYYQNQTNLLRQYNHLVYYTPLTLTCNWGFQFAYTYYHDDPPGYTEFDYYGDQTLNFDASLCQIASETPYLYNVDTACRNTTWWFEYAVNISPKPNLAQISSAFNQTCCPFLYKLCDSFLSMPALPSYPKSQIIGLSFGAALSMMGGLVELSNSYLSEIRKSLSAPRLLFFSLNTKRCTLPQKDRELINEVAAEYTIPIVDGDLRATLRNFQETYENIKQDKERLRAFLMASLPSNKLLAVNTLSPDAKENRDLLKELPFYVDEPAAYTFFTSTLFDKHIIVSEIADYTVNHNRP